MRRVVRHPQAERDIDSQVEYYLFEARSPEAAMRFVDAVEETLRSVVENPEIGPAREFAGGGLAGLRSFKVRGFDQHLVFYRWTGEEIEVVRLLHGARDLGRTLDES